MSDYSGEVVELEVARYGLRTFRHIPADEAYKDQAYTVWGGSFTLSITGGYYYVSDNPEPKPENKPGKPMELCSTAMRGSYWQGGVCEAACQAPVNAHEKLLIELAALTTGVEPVYGHQAPQEDCHCGVYAAHTLRALRDQFSGYMDNIIAVVAAEGQTIIGDKGFRTERARVVAYWCSESVAPTAETQFPDAERYPDVSPMLDCYGLEDGRPTPVERALRGVRSAQTEFSSLFPDPPPRKEASTRRRSYAWATVPNFAASALNFALFAASHSFWSLGFAIASLAFGVYLLVMVANS